MKEHDYARCNGEPGSGCAAASQQAEVLRSIIATLPEGVIVADCDGRFLFFNDTAKSILGIESMGVAPADWSQAYGCYTADGTTPYPADRLPLARALRDSKGDAARALSLAKKARQAYADAPDLYRPKREAIDEWLAKATGQ